MPHARHPHDDQLHHDSLPPDRVPETQRMDAVPPLAGDGTHRADGISRGAAAVVTLGNDREHLEVVREQAAHVLSFGKGSSTQAYPNSLMGAIALLRQTSKTRSRLYLQPVCSASLS